MKALAHTLIWISLLTTTLLGGSIRYVYCACSKSISVKLGLEYKNMCCNEKEKCMTIFVVSVPDGLDANDIQVDYVQMPLAFNIWNNTKDYNSIKYTSNNTHYPHPKGPPDENGETLVPLRI